MYARGARLVEVLKPLLCGAVEPMRSAGAARATGAVTIQGEVLRCWIADGRVKCGCWSLLCPWSVTWDGNATGANRRSPFFCQCAREERPNVSSVVSLFIRLYPKDQMRWQMGVAGW